MYAPRPNVNRQPTAPNAAVVMSAGKYLGASFGMKMLLLTTPIKFATGTPLFVSMTRLFSFAMLLLNHVSSMTLGALVPYVITKRAKYATWS